MSTVKKQIRDKDLASAETALRRAAERARKIAEQTRTPLVVYEGGHVVKKFSGMEKNRQGSEK
jgi:thiamine monophosphate synthase